ncbi:hypothetical protein PCANC_00366 [Puccinia coronata f. sp. avenae]|uniref:Uncharacterized protein n=1 Tax=Puccinia coronata f. sp. avenae TaxID=200324 RepID=A0A2N5W8W9_9BASI|nr:hypothetical protein PCANC_00366 [Puccinia coronata f. sp. avenae]
MEVLNRHSCQKKVIYGAEPPNLPYFRQSCQFYAPDPPHCQKFIASSCHPPSKPAKAPIAWHPTDTHGPELPRQPVLFQNFWPCPVSTPITTAKLWDWNITLPYNPTTTGLPNFTCHAHHLTSLTTVLHLTPLPNPAPKISSRLFLSNNPSERDVCTQCGSKPIVFPGICQNCINLAAFKHTSTTTPHAVLPPQATPATIDPKQLKWDEAINVALARYSGQSAKNLPQKKTNSQTSMEATNNLQHFLPNTLLPPLDPYQLARSQRVAAT